MVSVISQTIKLRLNPKGTLIMGFLSENQPGVRTYHAAKPPSSAVLANSCRICSIPFVNCEEDQENVQQLVKVTSDYIVATLTLALKQFVYTQKPYTEQYQTWYRNSAWHFDIHEKQLPQ